MEFPEFYQPERVGQLYAPETAAAFRAGSAAETRPASQDSVRTMLLLVDMQVDFVHTDGSLSVPGAVDDTRRVIEWKFRNLPDITTIAASLDSHLPLSIFFPAWWVVGETGQHPAPYTVIRSEDVNARRWRPIYEVEWSLAYCGKLESQAKKELMIWPYHTLIGTPGQALTPALYEAIAYHAAARQSQPILLEKGTIPKSEYYSIFEPEVKVPDHPLGGVNTAFLNTLAGYDRIYIAGEAKSHCVLETVSSLMRYVADPPPMMSKFRLLEDCTSSVVHPTIDFDALANRTLAQYQAYGLRMVRASDSIS